MSDNFTDEQKYILQLLDWGKEQLNKANLTPLPDFNNLRIDEDIKQQIIAFSKTNDIDAGKKKTTKNTRQKNQQKKSTKKINKNKKTY